MNDKVNKLYDQYQKRDFVFGDDNLNPKREIAYDKKINLIEKFDDIEKEIISRVEDLVNSAEFVDNSGPELEKLKKFGKGAAVKAPELKDVLGDIFPEVLQGVNPNLTNLLNNLIPLMDEEDRPDKPPIADDICGIGFTYSYLAEVVMEDADEELVTNENSLNDLINISFKSATSGEEPTENNDPSAYFENNDLAPYTGKNVSPQKTNEESSVPSTACNKMNFSILKVYYILLMIISMVNMILQIIFTILELVTQIIAFAGTCWNDPPAIGRIVELIINKIISLVMMLLNMLLQLLWNSMNLQCLSDSAKETLKQIRSLQTNFVSMLNGFELNKYEFSKLADDLSSALGSGEESSSSNTSSTTTTSSTDDTGNSESAADIKAEQEDSEAKAADDKIKALEGDSNANGAVVSAKTVTPQSSNNAPEVTEDYSKETDTN